MRNLNKHPGVYFRALGLREAALPLSLLLSACQSTTGTNLSAACQQSYEFGNYGCAEVTGRVLGSSGKPLSGVSVGPRFLSEPDAGMYNSPYVDTDSEGRFRFRIQRYAQRRNVPVPDTFSIYVRAAVRPPPAAGASSPAVDSVLVQLELAPIGQVPNPSEVEIHLSYP